MGASRLKLWISPRRSYGIPRLCFIFVIFFEQIVRSKICLNMCGIQCEDKGTELFMNNFSHCVLFCDVYIMCDGINLGQIVGMHLFVMWCQCLFIMGLPLKGLVALKVIPKCVLILDNPQFQLIMNFIPQLHY